MRRALLLLLVTSTAFADRPATLKLTLSVTSKPPVSMAGPSFTADPVVPEGLARAPRSEHEQILKDLIANTPDSEVEEKADYLFRLGELYGAQTRIARERGDEQATRDGLTKTTATFKQLTDTPAFRYYPKMDIALFELGYVLRIGGREQEARAAFDKLLKSYPASKYIPDAHIVWGDAALEAGKLADAEARYNQALKFPKAAGYYYAMYRTAWISVAKTQPTDALERLFQVAQGTAKDAKQAALHDAAARDFARVYAEAGSVAKALPAFKRVDTTLYPAMLVALADRLVEQGKASQAIDVYTGAITAEPDHAEVCNWMTARAHAVAYAGSKQWIEVCASEAGVVRAWARNNGGTSN